MSAALQNPLPDPRRHDGPAILPLPPRPAAPTKTDTGEFAARDVVNALRYHSILFIFLGSLLAAAAGFGAWNLFPAKYTAEALLQAASLERFVVDKGPNGVSRQDFGTFLSTQAAMIKSHKILSRALGQNVGQGRTLKQLPMIDCQADPISYLNEKLTIEFSDRSEIVKVGMAGDDPQQITAAVNAVVDAYTKEVEAYRQFRQKAYDRLLHTKNEREKELEELRRTYEAQFRPAAGNVAKLKSKEARIASWIQIKNEESRVQNDIRRVREALGFASARLKIQQEQDAKPTEVVVPELSAYVDNDAAVRKQHAEVESLEKYVTRRITFDADKQNEHIRDYQKRLTRARSVLEELKKETRARLTKAYLDEQRKKPGVTDAAVEVLNLQKQLEKLQIDERIVKEDATKFADLMTDEQVAGKPPEQLLMEIKLQQVQEHVARLISQVDSQKIELAADDRITLYEKAHVPQNKEMKKQLAFTGVAGLAGYGLIGGLVTVFEMRRKRVYSHRDPLFSRLPLLGRIPEHGFVLPSAGADPASDDAAGLAFREAIDRVKTLAIRQMARGHMRSVLIASPGFDEGKSILAWNLAAGFARTDYRVLFVDANFIRPTIDAHLDMPAPRGLAEVLRGECSLPEVVLDTPVPNLHCLAAGHADDEARRALDKPALTKLLDRTRGQYDFVVFDTCALGEAVDPLCLAQRVDAVILSLRTFKSRTPAAEVAARQLHALGTPLLGVVLTDPTLKAGEI